MKKLLFLIAGLVIAGTAWSADEWLKLRPVATDTRVSFPADQQKNNTAIDRVLANYREGMTLTYSSASTIAVTAGEIVCSNSDGSVRKMRKNSSNTNVTFSDIDTGSEGASTTYYVYAVADADAETATFKISASSTAPTGVTYYKRLGSFYNDSSSAITRIVNDTSKQVKEWESKSCGSTYQALTDGQVIATTKCGTSDPSNSYISIYSDNTSSPTTERAVDGCVFCSGCGTAARDYAGSASIDVKAGDYYKAIQSNYDGSPTCTMYFVPNN